MTQNPKIHTSPTPNATERNRESVRKTIRQILDRRREVSVVLG